MGKKKKKKKDTQTVTVEKGQWDVLVGDVILINKHALGPLLLLLLLLLVTWHV